MVRVPRVAVWSSALALTLLAGLLLPGTAFALSTTVTTVGVSPSSVGPNQTMTWTIDTEPGSGFSGPVGGTGSWTLYDPTNTPIASNTYTAGGPRTVQATGLSAGLWTLEASWTGAGGWADSSGQASGTFTTGDGSISLTKTDDTGVAGVNGATFGVYVDANATTLATPDADGNDTCTTTGGSASTAAACTFVGLPPGTYYVKEISAPAYHQADTTVATATVAAGATTAISRPFVDARDPGSVLVTKADDAGIPVGGATFGIFIDPSATQPAPVASGGSDACTTESTGPTAGTCLFTGLEPGMYYVTETQAPPGYGADPTVQAVVVTSDETSSPANAFVDPRHPGSIGLTKVDDAGAGVNGAVLGVYTDPAATAPAVVESGGNQGCTTAGGSDTTAGTCTLAGLAPGIYYVKETSAPAHHAVDGTIATVVVTSDMTTAIGRPFVDPRDPTSLSLVSSADPSVVGQSVTFTATVGSAGGTPDGSVQFRLDGADVGAPVALASGQAQLTLSTLGPGTHTIEALYGGSADFQGSSGTLSQQVGYGIRVLFDETKVDHGGSTIPIKIQIVDAAGVNLSSEAIQVTLGSPAITPSVTPQPTGTFSFGSSGDVGPMYQLNLRTKGYASRTYTLSFFVAGDPVEHTIRFTIG